MLVTKAMIEGTRRYLLGRAARRTDNHPQFQVRPISEAWRIANRTPAYRTAVANAAYIWRDGEPADKFGPMPAKFASRGYELRRVGLILPRSAPQWAKSGYRIWEEADAAAQATGDKTAVSAWHVVMEIPGNIRPLQWASLVTDFIKRELADRGAATAWAIHALQGADGEWIVAPHAHLIATARYWRHDYRHGQRHPAWIGSWRAQARLQMAWRRHCEATGLFNSMVGRITFLDPSALAPKDAISRCQALPPSPSFPEPG